MKTQLIFIAVLAAASLFAPPGYAQRGGQAGGPPETHPASPPSTAPARAREPRNNQNEIERATPPPRSPGLAERLQVQTELRQLLRLTPEQQTTLARIQERERAEIQTINQRWLLTRTQKERRIQECIDRHEKETRAALTADQQRLLDQWQDRERMQQRDQLRTRDATLPDHEPIRDRDRDRDRQPPQT